jgi:hypothetical protein
METDGTICTYMLACVSNVAETAISLNPSEC